MKLKKQMNYKLLISFLLSQVVEFFAFYLISLAIASLFALNTLNVFIFIVGIDIISTTIVFGKDIQQFINAVFNKEIDVD